MRGLYRRLLLLLVALMPLLIAATPAQSGQLLPDWWRWWHWLILFLIFVPFALWRTIVAAWGDAPPPPPPPAKRVAETAPSAAAPAASAPQPAAPTPQPAAATPPTPSPASAAAAPGDVPPPVLVEITDDMDPAAVRKARIANAKAMSTYKKALRAAGIDPATVATDAESGSASAPATADPAPVAPTPAAAVASGETEATISTAPPPEAAATVAESVAPAREAVADDATESDDGVADEATDESESTEAAAPAPTGTPETAAAAAASTSAVGRPEKQDLRKIEGIGPKIAGLLSEAGIETFARLAEMEPEKIRAILEAAGPRYRLADPTSWGQQAALAAAEKWEELAELQESLKGGHA